MDSVATMNMAQDHPWLAMLRNYGAQKRSHPSNEITCRNCNEVEKLTIEYVTYCPNPKCKKLRTESVLLQCPNCSYDFRTYSREQIWMPRIEALRQFNVYYKTIAISEAVASLYGSQMPDHVGILASDISQDETLLGISRCSMVGDSGGNRRRDTVILFTSKKIVWVSQGIIQGIMTAVGLASPEGYFAEWNQVQDVSWPTDRAGVYLKLMNGSEIFFAYFSSTGVSMSRNDFLFTSTGIRQTMLRILRASREIG